MFKIRYASVDGAGYVRDDNHTPRLWETLEVATAEADRLQAVAASHGNPWNYMYRVLDADRQGLLVYDTSQGTCRNGRDPGY